MNAVLSKNVSPASGITGVIEDIVPHLDLVGKRPAIMAARVGAQIGLTQQAWSKRIPRSAMPSMFGVRTRLLP